MRLATLGVALLVVACADSPDLATDSPATVTDSAGITIVQNNRPVWREGEGWQVSAEPILSISDTVALGAGRWLRATARLSNGDVLVLSDQGGRWFSPDGSLMRTFAHQGEGPGEFRYAGTLLVTPGDSVVVAESGILSRIAWFGPGGELLKEERIEPQELEGLGKWAECASSILPDYSLLRCQHDSSIPHSATNRPSRIIEGGWSSPGPGLLRQLRRIHRVPPTLDTSFALGLDIGIEQFGVSLPNGRETFVTHPFYTRTFVAAGGAPMRIAIATNPEWQIEVWTPEGRLERIVRLDGGRRTPTDAEVAWADSQLRADDFRGRLGDDQAIKARILSEVGVPDSLPGHAALVMAKGGELINRGWSLWRSGTPTSFNVFDREGRWLGDLTLPPKFWVREVGDDYLLGLRFDDDDVVTVEVYGLER